MHGSLFDGHYFFYSHWTHLINHKIVTHRMHDSLHERPIRTFTRSFICVRLVAVNRSAGDCLLNDLRWPTLAYQIYHTRQTRWKGVTSNWLALHCNRIGLHLIDWSFESNRKFIQRKASRPRHIEFPSTHQKRILTEKDLRTSRINDLTLLLWTIQYVNRFICRMSRTFHGAHERQRNVNIFEFFFCF